MNPTKGFFVLRQMLWPGAFLHTRHAFQPFVHTLLAFDHPCKQFGVGLDCFPVGGDQIGGARLDFLDAVPDWRRARPKRPCYAVFRQINTILP